MGEYFERIYMEENDKKDILGTGSVSKLMIKFAIPSIIGMLVSALDRKSVV